VNQQFSKFYMHKTVVARQGQENLEFSLSDCEWLMRTCVKVDVEQCMQKS
jgi:hypothetical protein